MINDPLAHFEKLLDEFEEDALAAARDKSNTPSASKRNQYNLTRRNILAFVEKIVLESSDNLDDAVEHSNEANSLRKERDLLGQYLYDAVGDMSDYELGQASDLVDLEYCQVIIDKALEFAE